MDPTLESDPKTVRSNTTNSSSNSDVNNVYTRFEAFNFDEDQQFKAGLARITGVNDADKTKQRSATDLMKIKAFYYARHVEALDFSAYMSWYQTQRMLVEKTDQQCPTSDSSQPSPISAHTDSLPSSFDADSSSPPSCIQETSLVDQNKNAVADTVEVIVEDRKQAVSEQGSPEVVQSQLTFAEVAELMQKGEPLPGLSQIEVFPTNQVPTPSQLYRSKKPWEK